MAIKVCGTEVISNSCTLSNITNHGITGQNNFLAVSTCSLTSTGCNNIFIGSNAGLCTTTGSHNIFLGRNAGCCNVSGCYNSILGFGNGQCITTGLHNTVIGMYAGKSITSGCNNVFFGNRTGSNVSTNCNNVFVGSYGGYATTSGRNVFLGTDAGRCISSGGCNVILGGFTGSGCGSVNFHVFIADGNGNRRAQFNDCGAFGLAGDCYGTAGQILTSCGSTAPPAWVTSSFLAPTVATTYSAATFSAGGNLSTSRSFPYGVGTQNDALVTGGFSGMSSLSSTEVYNGTSWSAGVGLNVAGPIFRANGGSAGLTSSALIFGGCGSSGAGTCVESYEFDGTSWSIGGSLPASRGGIRGAGTQTAAFGGGGNTGGSSSVLNNIYNYDGTSWSSITTLLTSRVNHSASGTQAAGFFTGGTTNAGSGATTAVTEEYNGSIVSSGGNLIAARSKQAGSLGGTQTSSVVFGGGSGSFGSFADATTEEYDGTTWSSGNSDSTARREHAGIGTKIAALFVSGLTGGGVLSASTVEYTAASSAPSTSGTKGAIRYNDDTSKFQGYNGSAWVDFY